KHLGKNQLTANGRANAGFFGWGEGLFLNNTADVQKEGTSITGGYSLRTDWLNPGISEFWHKIDWEYVPPAVTITLTPRYIAVTKSPESKNNFFFRTPDGGALRDV